MRCDCPNCIGSPNVQPPEKTKGCDHKRFGFLFNAAGVFCTGCRVELTTPTPVAETPVPRCECYLNGNPWKFPCYCPVHSEPPEPKADEVEDEIEDIVSAVTEKRFSGRIPVALKQRLERLVALARQVKP